MFKSLRKLYTMIKDKLSMNSNTLSIKKNILEIEKRLSRADAMIEELTAVLNDQQRVLNHLAKIQFDLSMSQTLVEAEIQNISSHDKDTDMQMIFLDDDDEFIN